MNRNQEQIEEEGVKSLRQKIDIREMGVRSRIPLNKEYLQRMNKQIESQSMEATTLKEEREQKINPTTTLMTTIHEQLRYYPKTK